MDKVRAVLPDADDDTHRLICAIAGLLAHVGHCEQDYSPAEEAKIREELGRVHVLNGAAVDAICAALRTDMGRMTSDGDHAFCRDVRELCTTDGRIEVLEALVEVAAADGRLSLTETNYLRRLVPSLGLTQSDYVAVQARHRDKLTVLER